VLAEHEKRATKPKPAEAREIAIATGLATPASDNTYALPMSKEAEKALGAEQFKIRSLYSAIESIATTGLTVAQTLELGKKHYCRQLGPWSAQAAHWLLDVSKEVARHEQAAPRALK